MEINSKNIKLWSDWSSSLTGLNILEQAKNDKDIIVVTCDVSTSAEIRQV